MAKLPVAKLPVVRLPVVNLKPRLKQQRLPCHLPPKKNLRRSPWTPLFSKIRLSSSSTTKLPNSRESKTRKKNKKKKLGLTTENTATENTTATS